MLQHARRSSVAWVAAALVAVTLSGATRVFAMHAPVEGHRCSCKAHGGHHECDCATCRKAMLAAQAADGKGPPCHRAAARKMLSQAAPAGSRGAPCVEGTCGGASRPVMAPAGVEPFCLGSAAVVALAERCETLSIVARCARGQALEPEIPPPRGA